MSGGLAAFLNAVQRGEPCRMAFRPGSELAFSPQPQPVLTLSILPARVNDTLMRGVLTRRFQHPDRFDDCFISLEADGSLAVLCYPLPDDNPHDVITTLSALLDLR